MRSTLTSCGFLLAVGLAAGCGGNGGSNSTAATAELPPFVDVPWVLDGGLEVTGWEAVRPSATFTGGTVGGSTGCNRFTAPFTLDGSSLRIGTIASTKIACQPPADAVEREYLDALGRVARWRSDGSRLVLLDENENELLRYAAATPVGQWEATAIQTGDALASPLPGTKVTARFAADGTLTGLAGCNSYHSSFTTDRGGIKIDPPAATRKACASPDGVMEQEAAYLASLPTADPLPARRRVARPPSG